MAEGKITGSHLFLYEAVLLAKKVSIYGEQASVLSKHRDGINIPRY